MMQSDPGKELLGQINAELERQGFVNGKEPCEYVGESGMCGEPSIFREGLDGNFCDRHCNWIIDTLRRATHKGRTSK